MKKFFKFLTAFFSVFFAFVFILIFYSFYNLPSKYIVTNANNQNIKINNFLTVKNSLDSHLKKNFLPVNKSIGVFKNSETKNVMFLDFVPVKKVSVEYCEEQQVLPCGTPFGVKIFTQGVLVVSTCEVKSGNRSISPSKNSGIKKGDVILQVNDETINNNDDLLRIVENSDGRTLNFLILRNNLKFNVDIKAEKHLLDGKYKIGAWIRDSSAGIGTLTFHDPVTNIFGGLGHGICDVDTGDLLPLSHGDIVKASINGVVKGQRGVPGELKGYFIETEAIGKLLKNTESGVYGTLNTSIVETMPLKVSTKQDVKIGPAQIATTLEGISPKFYNIYIQNINFNENLTQKNMIIKTADENLNNKTGGIIQGMSGSPIIQDGKLVGAITHVFVNDPSKGYAIFAENMIYNDNIPNIDYKINKAS